MMVLSEYDFPTFGNYITDPAHSKSAPKQFYTQIEIDLLSFVDEFEHNPFTPSPVKNIHPSTLRDGFYELQKYSNKSNKGIALESRLDAFSYAIIRHGFIFASQKGTRFFPVTELSEIEQKNYKFYRTMYM